MSHRKTREQQAAAQREWYEAEQERLSRANAAVAQQRRPTDGFRVVELPALADDLARVDGVTLVANPTGPGMHPVEPEQVITDPSQVDRDLKDRRLTQRILPPIDQEGITKPLFASAEAYPAIKRQPIHVASNGHQEDHMTNHLTQGGTAVEGTDRGEAMNTLIAQAYGDASSDVDLVTISVRHEAWRAEQQRLADLGLRRCPRCRKISPENEFNATGYCRCRLKVNGNPYVPGEKRRRRGLAPVERAANVEKSSADGRKVEREESHEDGDSRRSTVEPTSLPTPPWTDSHLEPPMYRPGVDPEADAPQELVDMVKAIDANPATEGDLAKMEAGLRVAKELFLHDPLSAMRSNYFELLCQLALSAKPLERETMLDRIEANLARWAV